MSVVTAVRNVSVRSLDQDVWHLLKLNSLFDCSEEHYRSLLARPSCTFTLLVLVRSVPLLNACLLQ